MGMEHLLKDMDEDTATQALDGLVARVKQLVSDGMDHKSAQQAAVFEMMGDLGMQ